LNVMRAQLARTPADFQNAVGDEGDPRRDELRTQLQIDFAFIAAYWLVFATMSGLLATRDFAAAVWLGAITGEVATVAALLDVAENVQTLRVVRLQPPAESLVRNMRATSLAKWLAAFCASGLLSPLFLQQQNWWHRSVGIGYALAAAVGIVAAIGGLASRRGRDPRVVQTGLRAAFLLLVVSQVVGVPVAAASL
jgi:hypothetical protein